MRFTYDHDLHIHSRISPCGGDPNQTPERILQYAVDNGLKTICVTDHYWDGTVDLTAPVPVRRRSRSKVHFLCRRKTASASCSVRKRKWIWTVPSVSEKQ